MATQPFVCRDVPEVDQVALLCRACCERLMFSFRQGMASNGMFLILFVAASSETNGKFIRAATALLTRACDEADSPEPLLTVPISSGQSLKIVCSRPRQLPLMSALRNHPRCSAAMVVSIPFACGHLLSRTCCLQVYEVFCQCHLFKHLRSWRCCDRIQHRVQFAIWFVILKACQMVYLMYKSDIIDSAASFTN